MLVRIGFFILATLLFSSEPAMAQVETESVFSDQNRSEAFSASPRRALGLSLLLPGMGHRYSNNGQWNRWAIAYAATDVSLWLSLIGGKWRRNHLVSSYTTLAAGSAGALVAGKDRTFFLNLASFESSDEFRETMLRIRAWDQIDYVSDAAFQWEWESDRTYNEFRDLRNRAETLRRRRSVLIASLVANRILSGAVSARRAGRNRRVSISAALAPPVESVPVLALRMGF